MTVRARRASSSSECRRNGSSWLGKSPFRLSCSNGVIVSLTVTAALGGVIRDHGNPGMAAGSRGLRSHSLALDSGRAEIGNNMTSLVSWQGSFTEIPESTITPIPVSEFLDSKSNSHFIASEGSFDRIVRRRMAAAASSAAKRRAPLSLRRMKPAPSRNSSSITRAWRTGPLASHGNRRALNSAGHPADFD